MAAVPQSASSPQGDPLVTVARDGGVVRLTLTARRSSTRCPEDLMRAVQAELERVAGDPSARVVVIGGAGKARSAPATTCAKCAPIRRTTTTVRCSRSARG